MKNNFEYNIEKSNVFTFQNKSLVLLHGSCVHTSKEPINFYVVINNKEVPFNVVFTEQNSSLKCDDGLDTKNNGNFYISTWINNKVSSIELLVSCNCDSAVILQLSGRELISEIKESPICYSVSVKKITDGQKKQIEVFGWAFSIDKSDFEFYITNESGKRVDQSLYLFDQKVFFDLGLVNESSRKSRFHIVFNATRTEKYYLAFFHKNNQISIDLNEHFADKVKDTFLKCVHDSNWFIIKGFLYLKVNGPTKLFKRVFKGKNKIVEYDEWVKKKDVAAAELLKQSKHSFSNMPKMSFVVATYNTPSIYLQDMIDSVYAQSYSNWELCIADRSSDSSVFDYINDHYRDDRIKMLSLEENCSNAKNVNEAIRMASGDYIGFYGHKDTLSPDALYEFVKILNEQPNVKMIYSDEDKINFDGSIRLDPYFKSDFNLDLLRGNNYIGHLMFVKSDVVDELGGMRSEFNGAQDYDFVLRLIDIIEPNNIYHIPKVLYHCRESQDSNYVNSESRQCAIEAGRKALEEHFVRNHIDATVENLNLPGCYHSIYHLKRYPKISILIPNMDHIIDLKRCIDSIEIKSTYDNFEIIVIENNSRNEETFAYYKELEDAYSNVKIVYWKDEFNYSAINNFGATFALGEYYVLLNNDTEVIEPSWMEFMLGFCMRDDVGVVGAKLFYPDDTIQHAGVIIGLGGVAGHAFADCTKNQSGYFGNLILSREYSAVTAACMMVKANLYNDLGGLDPGYRVAFNDVDFCLRVRKAGYLVVFSADCHLYHFESKSRGLENTLKKVKRFNQETERFRKRWADIYISGDPYYNPNLTLSKTDFSLKE